MQSSPNPNPNPHQVCLGGLGRVMDLCRTSHFLDTMGVGPAKGVATLVREAERNGFVNDFFFIAPSRTADTWDALYTRFHHYAAALDELGIPLRWQHFMWAAHVHTHCSNPNPNPSPNPSPSPSPNPNPNPNPD